MAVYNKKPCGIMAFKEDCMQLKLSDLAKWRVKINEDISHIGKVLMHHLFDFAHEKNSLNITLFTSCATPRGKSCKDFYSLLGFRRSANNSMNLFGVNYEQKAKTLEQYFDYKKIKNSKILNPNEEFLLDF